MERKSFEDFMRNVNNNWLANNERMDNAHHIVNQHQQRKQKIGELEQQLQQILDYATVLDKPLVELYAKKAMGILDELKKL